MKIRLTLEYDGANYSGWQLQAGHDSIQARLEDALARIFNAPIRVHGAGRTDAGVHARGQSAAFTLPRPFGPDVLRRALNGILPRDIAIITAAAAADDFDPRRDARSRVYEYRVLNRDRRSAFDYRHSWLLPGALDLAAMNAAARIFIGEHDFAAFRSRGSVERSTTRRVIASQWRRADEFLIYRVEATAYLRRMVRTMVAATVAAGRGRLAPAEIATILAARDRARAPAAAPAAGLYLIAVNY